MSESLDFQHNGIRLIKVIKVIKDSKRKNQKKITLFFNPLNANPTKWPNTQTIHWQIADELFECV